MMLPGGISPSTAAAGLVAIALVAGTALDRRVPNEPVVRAGYRVLQADFHAHTRFSDGFLSPFDIVLQAQRRGLDVLAVTEHNTTGPGKMARWFSGVVSGPIIVVGEEVTTNKYHLHGIGLSQTVHAGDPLPDVLAEIHRQGGVAIAAHPVRRYWGAFNAQIENIDATEVMHPLAFGQRGSDSWRWPDMRDFYEQAKANGHELAAIGSSDYHAFSVLGVCRTLVFVEEPTAAGVIDAIKKKRTVVYDLDGKAYGDPELAKALVADPVAIATPDYGYHGSGLADRVTRTLGWLGMLGLALFGLRRRKTA